MNSVSVSNFYCFNTMYLLYCVVEEEVPTEKLSRKEQRKLKKKQAYKKELETEGKFFYV